VSLGFNVTKDMLDNKAAQAVMAMRSALEKIQAIQAWLANQPDVDGVDPLTSAPFGYSADEAYALRLYFGTVDGMRTANAATSELGRKMTGLE
jgi:hypothetical protein